METNLEYMLMLMMSLVIQVTCSIKKKIQVTCSIKKNTGDLQVTRMDLKPTRNSLGRNPLSDALHRNPGVVINGQGPGRHPPKGASYRDLGTMISEQGSGRHLNGARYIYGRV